jgi:protocatechuate 3,4-dioxygenase beta subunit
VRADAGADRGPYSIDDEPFRKNVTEGRPGLPLLLVLRLVDAATCTPIPNAVVEIWHADAGGAYSDFNGQSNATFMRGHQTSGGGGRVRCRTSSLLKLTKRTSSSLGRLTMGVEV